MLEFLLSSVLMQINTAKYAEVTHTDTEVKELRKQAKLTVKFIVDRLHKRVVDQENISSERKKNVASGKGKLKCQFVRNP